MHICHKMQDMRLNVGAKTCSNSGREFLYVYQGLQTYLWRRLPSALRRARSPGAVDTGSRRGSMITGTPAVSGDIDVGPYCDRKLRLEEIKTSMTGLVFELSGY
jgi:hypothetical protein